MLHKAVFTEQGGSASRVTAGTFANTISRLHGMAEEANDAVSACTHVDMSEAPRLLRSPEKECPQVCVRPPPSRRPQQWDTIEESVVPLERNLFGHLFGRTGIGEKMGRCTCEEKWRQRANTGMSSSRRKPTVLVYVREGHKKKAGKKKHVGSVWNILTNTASTWKI